MRRKRFSQLWVRSTTQRRALKPASFLMALAYGTRAEDANDRKVAPGNLRTPPKFLAPQHRHPGHKRGRTVSVFRHGVNWLRRLMLMGRLWNRVWLLPEPWPKPKPNLEITCHPPP